MRFRIERGSVAGSGERVIPVIERESGELDHLVAVQREGGNAEVRDKVGPGNRDAGDGRIDRQEDLTAAWILVDLEIEGFVQTVVGRIVMVFAPGDPLSESEIDVGEGAAVAADGLDRRPIAVHGTFQCEDRIGRHSGDRNRSEAVGGADGNSEVADVESRGHRGTAFRPHRRIARMFPVWNQRTYSEGSSFRRSRMGRMGDGSRFNSTSAVPQGRRGRHPSLDRRRTCSDWCSVHVSIRAKAQSESRRRNGLTANSADDRVSTSRASIDMSKWSTPFPFDEVREEQVIETTEAAFDGE